MTPTDLDQPRLWQLLETYHAVVYFAPERSQHYPALGLKGGWMAYFATRSAALGVVPAPVVTACFYNFKDTMVARALPDAWSYSTPDAVLQARLAVFDDAIRRILGETIERPALAEAAELAISAVRAADFGARPLAAAHAALPVPEVPHLALFWAAAALREHRGDGHAIALAAAGIDGCAANVLMAALGRVTDDQRLHRGWTEEDWAAARDRLRSRGWLDSDGAVTDAGKSARTEVETATDELATSPWAGIGESATNRLVALLTPVAVAIESTGGLPFPNPIGMPPIRREDVSLMSADAR